MYISFVRFSAFPSFSLISIEREKESTSVSRIQVTRRPLHYIQNYPIRRKELHLYIRYIESTKSNTSSNHTPRHPFFTLLKRDLKPSLAAMIPRATLYTFLYIPPVAFFKSANPDTYYSANCAPGSISLSKIDARV